MKKIVLIYGTIAGIIVGGMFGLTIPFLRNGTLTGDNSMWVGYTTMVIALSLIFFGIKSYRDNHLGGAITFGSAFKVGILITLIASIMYCLSWEFYYSTVWPNFMEWTAQNMEAAMRKKGSTEQEIATSMADFRQVAESYKNPLVRFAYTFIEIFPVGLIITLLSATLLRRKEFLPVG
ncbi:DUF4199 domain-containing protein [Spirosoma sp. BT702]|uniref:DUF4199 domain-containing protein n=1 Tax=Spirosoma profusum TaxID=2771354 RepID=A0A927AQX3_9BACT|nr:DUF4199 domain-containing protein [Spirosoma profusum]MBD2701321.1 DUF4199 domain-containing protein [Spirosoma profusum]